MSHLVEGWLMGAKAERERLVDYIRNLAHIEMAKSPEKGRKLQLLSEDIQALSVTAFPAAKEPKL